MHSGSPDSDRDAVLTVTETPAHMEVHALLAGVLGLLHAAKCCAPALACSDGSECPLPDCSPQKPHSAQVVVLSSRCGEAGGDAVQLAVVRALLTVVTAEHFVVHGDCLMQARAQGHWSV